MKGLAYNHLATVGYFTNHLKVNVMEQDVLPWLYQHVDNFVHSLDTIGKFPDEIMMYYFDETE